MKRETLADLKAELELLRKREAAILTLLGDTDERAQLPLKFSEPKPLRQPQGDSKTKEVLDAAVELIQRENRAVRVSEIFEFSVEKGIGEKGEQFSKAVRSILSLNAKKPNGTLKKGGRGFYKLRPIPQPVQQ